MTFEDILKQRMNYYLSNGATWFQWYVLANLFAYNHSMKDKWNVK